MPETHLSNNKIPHSLKKFAFIVFLLLVSSCKSPPNVKQKKDIKRVIQRTIVELPKEKVVYKIDTIYKDTTIIRHGKVVNLSVKYDVQGKIKQAECEAPGGKVIKEKIKENIKEKKQTKYVNKKDMFVYGLIFGVFFMLALILVLLFKK